LLIEVRTERRETASETRILRVVVQGIDTGGKDQRCGFLTIQVKATHSHITQQMKITGEALQNLRRSLDKSRWPNCSSNKASVACRMNSATSVGCET